MIVRVFKVLLLLQIIGTTAFGFIAFDLKGMLVGFIVGVMIAGHFITVLNTRDINTQNAKILKNLLEEIRKIRESQTEDRPQLTNSKESRPVAN